MRIAIIGAGSVGCTLGLAWARSGHSVRFGVRNPNDEKHLVLMKEENVAVASNGDAARDAEVIVLCTPWQATEPALRECGNLTGKIVIDCTNPLTSDFSALEFGHTTSGLEQVAKWAIGADVFKAMNQIGSNLMDQPKLKGGTPVMFVCGDGAGKSVVLRLVAELGFEAVDAGGTKIARLLEPYALLWIHLALVQGHGRDFAFGLLRK